jgi:hypothetical protein
MEGTSDLQVRSPYSYFSSKSCCSEENRSIQNSSDFESINKLTSASFSEFAALAGFLSVMLYEIHFKGDQYIALFYPKPVDIPVKFSSLLI